MLDVSLELDESLFLYLNGLGTPYWDPFWLYLSRTFSGITLPLYFLLLAGTYRSYGLRIGLLLIGVAIILIVSTEFLSVFVKNGVGRLRPCYTLDLIDGMRLIKSYCGGQFGYFSAHACNSFALATFFGLLLQKRMVLFPLLVWAFLVSYSRIYIGVHYPLDVFTGMLVGLFFGWLYSALFLKKLKVDLK